MAQNSTKNMANIDYGQTLRFAFNENERTIAVGSFITGKIGHKITQTTVNPQTLDYTYTDNGTILQVIRVAYTDSTLVTFLSAERIA